MKSFLGGLALATGMALLNGTGTPPPAMCLLLPNIESYAPTEFTEDTCSAACSSRRSTLLAN